MPRILYRLFCASLTAGLLTACGSLPDREEGALPGAWPGDELVALTYDVAAGRLIKAHSQALYQSQDGGRTWERIPLPRSVKKGRITAVSVPRSSPGTLFVAGPGFGIVRSQDGGATWHRLSQGLPNLKIEAFAVHSQLGNTLYVSLSGDGIYRSEDGGKTWKRMDRGPGQDVRQLFHSNLAGSMKTGWLFAATSDGVRRSMDCFCGWREAGGVPELKAIHSVVFDPDRPEHIYAAGTTAVFRSVDGGETWEVACADGPEKIALAFDPSAGILYAGARDGTILRSLDQGSLWERIGG